MSTRNFFVTDARMMMADSDNRSYPLDGAALVLDDDRDNRRIREELSARRLVEICQRMENEIYVTKDKFPEIDPNARGKETVPAIFLAINNSHGNVNWLENRFGLQYTFLSLRLSIFLVLE